MLKTIIKRSGEKVPFDASKIRGAIFKANVRNATEKMSDKQLDQLTQAVVAELEKTPKRPRPTSCTGPSTRSSARWTTSW